MIQQLVDQIAAQFQPAAQALGATAQAQAERIVSRLDRIANAVESEDFNETRIILPFGGLTGSNPFNLGIIPEGTEWEIESISCHQPTVASEANPVLRMLDRSRPVAGADALLWAAPFTQSKLSTPAFGPVFLYAAPKLVLPGGTDPYITLDTTPGAGVGIFTGTVIYVRKQAVPGKLKYAPGPTVLDVPGETGYDDSTARHQNNGVGVG